MLTSTCAAEAMSFAYCMISSSSRVLICHAASQLQHLDTLPGYGECALWDKLADKTCMMCCVIQAFAVSSEALQTHCSQVSGSMSGHQDMQRAETLTTRHSVKTENAVSFSTLNPSMPLNVAASV